jgi:hypothetical protein
MFTCKQLLRPRLNNGNTTSRQRPSSLFNTQPILCTSTATAMVLMFKLLLPTQDGSSNSNMNTELEELSTIRMKQRYFNHKDHTRMLINNLDTSMLLNLLKTHEINGILSMLRITRRRSSRRAITIQTGASRLKLTSILFQEWDHRNTLISSPTRLS